MLRRDFKREVEGGVRKWDAEVGDDLRRELATSKDCSYQASKDSKCALAKSKKLAAERLQLLDDKLQLARELTALKGEIASEAKKHVRLPPCTTHTTPSLLKQRLAMGPGPPGYRLMFCL